jgi:antitoxin YefM
MTTITEAELRTVSGAVLDRVRTNHEPLQVKLANGENIVLSSLEDYNARSEMDETDFLLSNPKSAAQLRKAIADYEAGLGVRRELVDDTDFLLSSPANAEALRSAIDRLEQGQGIVVDLDALAV